MAEYNTDTTLAGITKEAYADDLEKMPFEDGLLQQMVPFEGTDGGEGILGKQYNQPVMLTQEHGVTYNGTSGAVVALNTAIAGASANATVTGAEMIFRGRIAYAIISRAASKGKKAFRKATSLLLENLNDTGRKRVELSILYGQKGLAQVSSISAGVITITDATWSAATWVDQENSIIESFDAQTASANQHNGDLTISAVDLDNKTITVTGTSSAVVANDWLYFKGARTTTGFNEMLGLSGILGNTTGTVFGISATTYSRWKGNLNSSFGPVSMGRLLEAITKPVNRGLKGEVIHLLPTKAFEVLNTDMAALRRLDSSYERAKAENGQEAIAYHYQRGVIMIQAHPLLRDGDMMSFPKKVMKRVGSSDLRFGPPGMPDALSGDIWFHLQEYNASETRLWTDQAVFVERPAHCQLFTGVTYV